MGQQTRWVQRIVCGFLAVSLAGCGYTTKVTLPSGVKTIYVPTFTNEVPQSERYTYESGLEIDITNAVIDRLLYDGNLKVVKENEADAILVGAVTAYRQESMRYTSTEGVKQYRLYIATHLVFKKRATGEVIWEETGFVGYDDYFIEGGDAISERAAANNAIEDVAKKIVDRIVEDW